MSMYATGNAHFDAYTQAFKPGESYRVSCDPIIHRMPIDPTYPLANYDGHLVKVAVEQARFPRVSWPDDNRIVEVILPFPFKSGHRTINRLAILGSLLTTPRKED